MFEISAVSMHCVCSGMFLYSLSDQPPNSLFWASCINGNLVPKAVVVAARAGADEVLVRLLCEIDAVSYHEVDRSAGVEVGKEFVEIGNEVGILTEEGEKTGTMCEQTQLN